MNEKEYTPSMQEVRDLIHLGAFEAVGGEHNLDTDKFWPMIDRFFSRLKHDVWNEGYDEANDDLGSGENSELNPYG